MDQRRGLMHMDPSPLRDIGQRANIRRTVPSASVLTISPPKPTTAAKGTQDDAPTPNVLLKQFQPKQVLEFGDVALGTSRCRNLLLVNPSAGPQAIELAKSPSAEKGFRTDSVFPSIFPGQSLTVPFHWEPVKEGKMFESVLIQTTDGHRIQVSLTGNCFKKVAKVVRRGPNRRGALVRPVIKQGTPQPQPNHPIRRMSTYTVSKGPVAPETDDFQQQIRSAVMIQAAWRGYATRKRIYAEWRQRQLLMQEEMLAKRLEQERIRAVVTIQAHWRGFCARRLVEQMILALEEQRILAVKREQERTNSAAVLIQSYCRMFLAKQVLRALRTQRDEERVNAAVVIQAHWRGFCARRLVNQMILALEEQRILREKREQERTNSAAVLIQSYCRMFLAKRILRALRDQRKEQRVNAAIVIQAHWRGFCARRLVKQMIQALEEQRILDMKREQERTNSAAVLIQSYCRMFLAKRILRALRDQREEQRVNAAIVIQAHWRGFCARRMARLAAEAKKAE